MARDIGPRPSNPQDVSFAPECFEIAGYRTEYVVSRAHVPASPARFETLAEAEAFAHGRPIAVWRTPIQRRIRWR